MAKKQHDHLKKKHREKNGNGTHSQLGDILSLTRAFMTGTHGFTRSICGFAHVLGDVYRYSIDAIGIPKYHGQSTYPLVRYPHDK